MTMVSENQQKQGENKSDGKFTHARMQANDHHFPTLNVGNAGCDAQRLVCWFVVCLRDQRTALRLVEAATSLITVCHGTSHKCFIRLFSLHRLDVNKGRTCPHFKMYYEERCTFGNSN